MPGEQWRLRGGTPGPRRPPRHPDPEPGAQTPLTLANRGVQIPQTRFGPPAERFAGRPDIDERAVVERHPDLGVGGEGGEFRGGYRRPGSGPVGDSLILLPRHLRDMPTRRAVLVAGGLVLAGCAGRQETATPTDGSPAGIEVDTPTFEDGATIPDRHTCAGADLSPSLRVELPAEATAAAVVVDDIDADGFVHWTLWNVPASRTEIPEGVDRAPTVLGGARQGTNDFGEIGYGGPCPPEDDDAHTYRFTLYELDRELDLEAGADPAAFNDAMADASAGTAEFTGEFGR